MNVALAEDLIKLNDQDTTSTIQSFVSAVEIYSETANAKLPIKLVQNGNAAPHAPVPLNGEKLLRLLKPI